MNSKFDFHTKAEAQHQVGECADEVCASSKNLVGQDTAALKKQLGMRIVGFELKPPRSRLRGCRNNPIRGGPDLIISFRERD